MYHVSYFSHLTSAVGMESKPETSLNTLRQISLFKLGNPNFSNLLKRIVNRFKRAGYILDIMRQTACLVCNEIMVEGYAALFSCTAVGQASDSMTASMRC